MQQFWFFAWRLTPEQWNSLLGQLQQFVAFFDVVLVRSLVGRAVAHEPDLLGMEPAGVLVKDLLSIRPSNLSMYIARIRSWRPRRHAGA